MTSLDDASWQTNAEGSPQEASSGGSMYYNGPAHQRTFPVTFGSPLVYKHLQQAQSNTHRPIQSSVVRTPTSPVNITDTSQFPPCRASHVQSRCRTLHPSHTPSMQYLINNQSLT